VPLTCLDLGEVLVDTTCAIACPIRRALPVCHLEGELVVPMRIGPDDELPVGLLPFQEPIERGQLLQRVSAKRVPM
jgi:hypothetical protein